MAHSMRPGYFRERPFGIRYYCSSTPGIGGRLRTEPTDFRVEERPGIAPETLDADPGDYPYLVVEVTLTDRDTHGFVDELAKRLHINPHRIGWAGTKDARAVTTQLVSIDGVTPEELPTMTGVEWDPVGRFGRQLEFGDHAGNRFRIRVRRASHLERIPQITDELDAGNGRITVANLFGPQRFGIRRPISHRVGRAILEGDHRAAVRLYLASPSPHEPPPTRAARDFIAEVAVPEERWAEALERTPGYLDHERTLLAVLADHGEATEAACRTAIEHLPWSLKRLFVHALQSHLFNEILSERVRRGIPLDEPVVGDVICMVDDHGEVDVDRPQRVDANRLDIARRHCERGRAVVTAPLIGSETRLADGLPGSIERAVLEHAKLRPADFERSSRDEAGSRRSVRLTTAVTIEHEPLRFVFELPPGAYATIVLREYLKIDPLAMA